MKTKHILFSALLLALSLCTACGSNASAAGSASAASASSQQPEPTPEPGPAFVIDVPEGFSEAEMPGTLAYYTNENGAVISLTTSAKDPDFSTPDIDALVAALQPMYAEQLRDESMRIEVVSIDSQPVCGFPQLFVGIDADMTFNWVFTGTEEDMPQFRKCVESITNTVDL